MNHEHIEDRVLDYRWPEISPDVRHRVMSAPFVPAEPITWSERVWFSRAWRLSAAIAIVALIALDQLPAARPQHNTPPPQVMAEAQAIEEVATEVGLPVQTAGWLAQRAIFEATRPKASRQPGASLIQMLALDAAGGM
jgi:hypothetical protein